MNLVKVVHSSLVMNGRVKAIASHLWNLLPATENLQGLDVGCGSGEIAYLVGENRPNVHLEGIDVLVRPETTIPVQQFDGQTIPFGDRAFDFVMLVDVLHHANKPEKLLAECARVAKSFILIKDHYNNSWLDEIRLRFMDWFGNSAYGVALPYNYLSSLQWEELWRSHSLVPEKTIKNLNLYPPPAKFIFDSNLHFISRLKIVR